MKMSIDATTEDQFGGDSLFTFISKKEGKVELTNAEFKLSQFALAQGVDITATGNKRTGRVLLRKTDKELISGAKLSGVAVIAVVGPDGQKTDAVTVTATGAVTFADAAADGEYAVWYKADDATAVQASMLKNAMPEVATFNWMFRTEDSDGNKY